MVTLPCLLQAQSVIINEFQKDPPSGGAEFIELLNTGPDIVNLQGWQIGDERKLISIANSTYKLMPDNFLVITDDSAGFILQFGELDFLEKRSLPALNNSGDEIRLFNAEGELMDSLAYNSNWGGKDLSLERRSPDPRLSTFPGNWVDSPSAQGGTPGSPNLAQPDLEPPELLQAAFWGNSAIQLTYSEILSEYPATEVSEYEINGAPDLLFIQAENEELSLFFARPFNNGQRIQLRIPPQSDIFGNTAEAEEVELEYLSISRAMSDSVVINEVLFLKEDADSPEFIELYNQSKRNYNLDGWSLTDASGSKAVFPDNLILKAGHYLYVTDRQEFANENPNGIYLSNFPALNDNGDSISLKNSFDEGIDSLQYKKGFAKTQKGHSAERKDPRRSTSDPSNWLSSRSEQGHTAGNENSRFAPDDEPPRVQMASTNAEMSLLNLQFSEYINNEISPEIRLHPGNIPIEVQPAELEAGLISIQLNEIEQYQEVEIRNLRDEVGNQQEYQRISISFPPSKGDLIFTEVLYDPIRDAYDGFPDQTEYVEIYNRSARSLSLEGIRLREAMDEKSESTWLIPENNRFHYLGPGEYYLIYADEQSRELSDSELGAYFGLRKSANRLSAAVQRSSLSLSSEQDAIILTDSSGLTIDSLSFDQSWHNPNRFDHKGIALEKIRKDSEQHGPDEWSSSTHTLGGTPGRRNSIGLEHTSNCTENCAATNSLEISPNPFSPSDMDGFEDHLMLSYTLDHPDYLLDVDIFDRYGRHVRQLSSNQAAGPDGILVWDGFRDDGKLNRVGRYIILFRSRNNESRREVQFKKTVVIARR